MLPFVRKQDGAETKVLSKRELKKGTQIKWNSTLTFQLALMACFGVAFAIIESDIRLGSSEEFAEGRDPIMDDALALTYTIEAPKPVEKTKSKKAEPPKPKVNPTVIKVEKNDAPVIETSTAPTDVAPTTSKPKGTIPSVPKTPEGPKNWNAVQFVPIFPGCESLTTKDERKACMSEKIQKFIGKKFDTDKFSHLDTGKTHKVNVQFTIGKDGFVKSIRAKSAVSELEVEAKKVVGKIPQMKPGRQGDANVEVMYTVPIKFRVH